MTTSRRRCRLNSSAAQNNRHARWDGASLGGENEEILALAARAPGCRYTDLLSSLYSSDTHLYAIGGALGAIPGCSGASPRALQLVPRFQANSASRWPTLSVLYRTAPPRINVEFRWPPLCARRMPPRRPVLPKIRVGSSRRRHGTDPDQLIARWKVSSCGALLCLRLVSRRSLHNFLFRRRTMARVRLLSVNPSMEHIEMTKVRHSSCD